MNQLSLFDIPKENAITDVVKNGEWMSENCYLEWKELKTKDLREYSKLRVKKKPGKGLWRTADAGAGGMVSKEFLERFAAGNFKRDSGHQAQMRLCDQVRHNNLHPPQCKQKVSVKGELQLNPEFVEALMGYPQGWTKI